MPRPKTGAGGGGEQHPHDLVKEALQRVPYEQFAKVGFDGEYDADH